MSNIIDINKGKKVETIPTLANHNIMVSDYYIESTYKENDLTINI